jgi:fatty acid desaturase
MTTVDAVDAGMSAAAVPLRDAALLPPAIGTAHYARLRAEVRRAGLLERDHVFYILTTVGIGLGLAVSLSCLIRLPESVLLVVWAVVFAFFAVQVCGLIHDAGHRAIGRSAWVNDLVGLSGAALLAMGYHSWRQQHNAHHAHTNEDEADPDLAIPLHAFTTRQFQRSGGFWRVLRRHQALCFYPLRTLVVFSRRLSEFNYLRQQWLSPQLVLEGSLWLVGMTVWFVVPWVVFPLPKALLLFVVVHGVMGLYLSTIFAPNHKGMPQIASETPISFLEQQIVTSRNITPHWFTDVVYIGLNYQIEHHLFPTCPRSHLRHLTPYVVAICDELQLPYTQAGFVESHRQIVIALNAVAKSVPPDAPVRGRVGS